MSKLVELNPTKQNVEVEYTETGAKLSPYKMFADKWDENDNVTAREAIKQMGADFKVEKRPLIQVPQSVYDAIKNGEPIEKLELSANNLIKSHCATIRTDVGNSLGIVGSDYSVADNVESLSFVDMMEEVTGHRINITSGAVLGHGERFFLQGKLDNSILLDGDGGKDKVDQYITIVNSHNGVSGLSIYMTPLRIFCQNQLALALRTAPNKITFKHTKNLRQKIDFQIAANRERAYEVFKKSVKFTDEFEKAMQMLKAKQVTKTDTLDFVAKLYLDTAKYDLYQKNNRNWDTIDEISTRSKNTMNSLLDTIYNGVGQQGMYENTSLHLFNGLSCFQNNVQNYRSLESKVDSLLDGTESTRLNKGYQLLLAA